MNPGIIRLGRLGSLFLLSCHWVGCCWCAALAAAPGPRAVQDPPCPCHRPLPLATRALPVGPPVTLATRPHQVRDCAARRRRRRQGLGLVGAAAVAARAAVGRAVYAGGGSNPRLARRPAPPLPRHLCRRDWRLASPRWRRRLLVLLGGRAAHRDRARRHPPRHAARDGVHAARDAARRRHPRAGRLLRHLRRALRRRRGRGAAARARYHQRMSAAPRTPLPGAATRPPLPAPPRSCPAFRKRARRAPRACVRCGQTSASSACPRTWSTGSTTSTATSSARCARSTTPPPSNRCRRSSTSSSSSPSTCAPRRASNPRRRARARAPGGSDAPRARARARAPAPVPRRRRCGHAASQGRCGLRAQAHAVQGADLQGLRHPRDEHAGLQLEPRTEGSQQRSPCGLASRSHALGLRVCACVGGSLGHRADAAGHLLPERDHRARGHAWQGDLPHQPGPRCALPRPPAPSRRLASPITCPAARRSRQCASSKASSRWPSSSTTSSSASK